MSSSENISKWKQKAEIEYIALFVPLWLAFNAWMKDRYSLRKDRDCLNKLKNDDIGNKTRLEFGGLLNGATSQSETFRGNLAQLIEALENARITDDKHPLGQHISLKTPRIEQDGNGGYRYENIIKAKRQHDKVQLTESLWITDDINQLYNGYIETLYFVRCELLHGNLMPSPENERVIKFFYLTLHYTQSVRGYNMQVSTINYQDLNHEFRIDAEYYREEILNRLTVLDRHNRDRLDNLADFIIGPFGSTVTVDQYVDDSEFRYVRNKDINDFLIKDSELALIPSDVYYSLPKYHIKENDLLITVVGTLGKVAIATEKDTKSIFSCKSTIIRIKNINPFYLLTYLNTDTGKLFSLRGKRGAIQEGLNLPDLKEIQVLVPSNGFQELIETTVKQSFIGTEKSKELFEQAQTILLSELGLTNWQPEHTLTFIKNYSDTERENRIDAEYYQPKYEEIIRAIKNYSGGYSTIGKEFNQNKSTFKIDNNKQYKYVEIGSINVSNGEIIPNEVLGSELPANAKRALRKNDVIVSKVRTYRGAITIVEEDGYVGSGAFTVLSENGRINKETLLVFLHSKPLLAWSLKPNTGTSYPVIVDDDILSLSIPILPNKKQAQIQQKVSESFDLRKQSKHLLECAKKAVEMAIEEDEQTATKWLKEQTSSIEVPDVC